MFKHTDVIRHFFVKDMFVMLRKLIDYTAFNLKKRTISEIAYPSGSVYVIPPFITFVLTKKLRNFLNDIPMSSRNKEIFT